MRKVDKIKSKAAGFVTRGVKDLSVRENWVVTL